MLTKLFLSFIVLSSLNGVNPFTSPFPSLNVITTQTGISPLRSSVDDYYKLHEKDDDPEVFEIEKDIAEAFKHTTCAPMRAVENLGNLLISLGKWESYIVFGKLPYNERISEKSFMNQILAVPGLITTLVGCAISFPAKGIADKFENEIDNNLNKNHNHRREKNYKKGLERFRQEIQKLIEKQRVKISSHQYHFDFNKNRAESIAVKAFPYLSLDKIRCAMEGLESISIGSEFVESFSILSKKLAKISPTAPWNLRADGQNLKRLAFEADLLNECLDLTPWKL